MPTPQIGDPNAVPKYVPPKSQATTTTVKEDKKTSDTKVAAEPRRRRTIYEAIKFLTGWL